MSVEPITDCHAHIIDAARWPYAPGNGYFPGPSEQGDQSAYLETLAARGISRGVLVQPSGYGFDNRAMLEAIETSDGALRGIAVLDASATVAEMRTLMGQGVVGLRLNLGTYDPGFLDRPGADRFLEAVAEAGMFIEIYAVGDMWSSIVPRLVRPGFKVIIDHFGQPLCDRGLDQPGFRSMLGLAALPGAVLKLSSAFRVTGTAWPYPEADPFVATAIAAFGVDRCIWGSDWPFIAHPNPVTYDEQLALVTRWFPDVADQNKVLRDNPARLFFGGASS